MQKASIVIAAFCGVFPMLSIAHADIKMSPLFGDNMILQRNFAAPVWGTADAGEAVTVTINGQTQKTNAGADGKWMVKLAPLAAAESLEMTISGKNTLSFKNVAVGEVWIASGQSNMAYGLSGASGASALIASSNDPQLRLFYVKRNSAPEIQTTVEGNWKVAKPGTVSSFSAVGYCFVRQLRENLKVPVGMIEASVPGTAAQAWTSRAALEAVPGFKTGIIEPEDKRTADFTAKLAQFNTETLPAWQKSADAAKAAGNPVQPQPPAPKAFYGGGAPFHLFNAMIAPLIPYGIAGVVWYQGEGNASDPQQYRTLFPTMIRDWRARWNQGDFPFGFVQLANLGEQQLRPDEGGWARLREAQRLTLALPKTGMASAIDLGQSFELHPPNKQEVGQRLSLWALATVYGQGIEFSGPLYDSMSVEGHKIRLKFTHVGGGLVAQDNTARFGDEILPRHYPAAVTYYSPLDLLQSAGLLEGAPVAYDAQKLLTRREAAQIVAAVDAKLAAKNDPNLETTQLPAGSDRKKVQTALATLRDNLAPQIAQLKTPWDGQLRGFAIEGADGKWVWGDANIEGETVVVSSPQVSQPVAVRYGWSGNPIGNLTNKAGLPASSFATDSEK